MKRLFDISQDEKNRILEMHSAKKNIISEQSIIDTKWTKNYPCISDFGKMIPTTQTNKISFPTTDGKDLIHFYKNLKFIYEDKDGSILNGTWKCENDEMVINTEDGARYTSSKGWTNINQIEPSGTVNVPQPKKVVEGMTINLYNEKSESSQPKTHKIFKIIDKGSDGVELQLGDKELSLANPTVVFKCSGGMVMDNPIDTGGQVYNKQLENSLSAQFCQQNKQNITVPKADFAMNNQSTDTTTGIA